MTQMEDAIVARIEDRLGSINAWVDLFQKQSITLLDLAIALHTHADFLRRDAEKLMEIEIDEDETIYDDQT